MPLLSLGGGAPVRPPSKYAAGVANEMRCDRSAESHYNHCVSRYGQIYPTSTRPSIPSGINDYIAATVRKASTGVGCGDIPDPERLILYRVYSTVGTTLSVPSTSQPRFTALGR